MITILHGENNVASRNSLVEIIVKAQKEGKEVISLNGQKTTLEEIRISTGSNSLFGKEKIIIIDNLLSSQKSSNKTKIIEFLQGNDLSNEVILWEGKEIGKTVLISNAKVLVFKINQTVFRFLESLRPGNSTEMIRLLQETKKQSEIELIFSLLVRQIRFLIMVKDNSGELSQMPSWQISKFSSQTKFFSLEKLLDLYDQLLQFDYSQKTSGDIFNLSSRLDVFICYL